MKWLNLMKNETLYGLSEWEYFVWRHRGGLNLAFHFVSLTMGYLFFFWWLMTFNHWLLIGVPVAQFIGFYGHKFEVGGVRSKDVVSPMTSYYLFKIFFLIGIGKYQSLISSVERKVSDYQGDQT